MLDYYTACRVSEATGHRYSPNEVRVALRCMNQDFMQPCIERFSSEEATAYLQGNDNTEEFDAGYYWRLSAPGYLDATEWHGPFTTGHEAIADMILVYGPDELPEEDADDEL